MPVGPVIASVVLPAPRQEVWEALVDPRKTAIWWPDLQLDAVVGGAVSEIWEEADSARHAVGAVDIVIDGHSLGFNWQESDDNYATSVLIVAQTDGDRTILTVTETGLGMLDFAARRAMEYQEGWGYHLEDLRAFVAGELHDDEDLDDESLDDGDLEDSEVEDNEVEGSECEDGEFEDGDLEDTDTGTETRAWGQASR